MECNQLCLSRADQRRRCVVTFSGNLRFKGEKQDTGDGADPQDPNYYKNVFDGIFAAVVKGAELKTESSFVSARYDNFVFTNDQSGLTIATKAVGFYDYTSSNWFEDFKLLVLTANAIQYRATVSYLTNGFIELRYELTTNFTPKTDGIGAGDHTFYAIYEIAGTDIGAVTVGLCGEDAELTAGKAEVRNYANGLDDLNASYEGSTGTLAAIEGYKNNDTDGTWWQGGATDDINVSGDFAIVFVYDKIRDVVSPDVSIEFNADASYFNWELDGDPRQTLATEHTWTVTAREGFTAKKTIHGDFNGHTIVKLMRVGNKMQVSVEVYDYATGAMIYGADAVCENFITEDLTVRLNGNTFWLDNVKAYKCTLAAPQA